MFDHCLGWRFGWNSFPVGGSESPHPTERFYPQPSLFRATMTVLDGPCQRCGTEFDWRDETCPNCGWNAAAWVAGGRYDLGRAPAG